MKQIIFIDANIYLRFYDSNSREFKKLLKSIEEIKDSVFITKQVLNEIQRNKLLVFITSFVNYEKRFGLVNTSLPEHLEATTDKELKDWNIATGKLAEGVKGKKRKLKEITGKLIDKINDSKDEVSQTLAKIFLNSQMPTEAQVDRARNRKEVGNPPGKSEDPLGDQISWEQLLDKTKSIEELWIISNDRDYMGEFDKKCYLNPFLFDELKQKNESIKVFCFNTLSEGFTSFNKSKKISALPTEKELEEITTEEKKSNLMQNFVYGATGPTGHTASFGVKSKPIIGEYWKTEFVHPDQLECTGCGVPYSRESIVYGTKGVGYECPFCGTINSPVWY